MRYQEYKVLSDSHSDTITRVAFNEDGKLLASASLDGNLCVWNIKTGSLCYQYFTGHAILSIVWADLERILCGLKDGSIACLVINSETQSLDVTGTWGHSYPVEALTITKNRLASGAHKELFIWRWNYNAVMSYQEREVTLSEHSGLGPDEDGPMVTALHWSGRDGGGSPTLLIVGYIHHGIRIFETQRWGEVGHISVDGPLGSASVSPDNKYIAVSNVFTGFHIYRLDNGSPVAHFEQEVNEARPLPVTWLHGGRAILGGSTIGSINIWYIDTGRKVVCLPVPQSSKTLAIAAHYNSENNKHAFLVACGTETKDCKISTVIWRAEQRKDHESTTDSDDEDSESESESKSESNVEPEQVAVNDRPAVWHFSGTVSMIMLIGLLVALRLAGIDILNLRGL